MYYKVEAYRASEKAGKILYENGITPTYVSDNPVINAQHVVFEAAKAYGYGLPYHAALAGVTSAPAELLGLGERIGKIKTGFDADIVVWDSDPLSVGATPVQVWIDGAPQFENPVVLTKQEPKPTRPDPNLAKDTEMKEFEGDMILTGIGNIYLYDNVQSFDASEAVAIVSNGKLLCTGTCENELAVARAANVPTFEVNNGYITPPFTAFGSSLGLVEIDAEGDTHDGRVPREGVSRAIDGLQFGGKQLTRAFEHGVTRAISAPISGSIDAKGISVGFKTGAKHALEKGAVWQEETALHYILTLDAKSERTPSISSAIGLLRAKLLDAVYDNSTVEDKDKYEEKVYLRKVVTGSLPLILSAHSADTIASIIRLKSEIEAAISTTASTAAAGSKLRITVIGGAESHLVASELAAAGVSVVLAPLLPHAQTWDQRRGLTGAPLTNGTAIDALVAAGVLVGIGVEEVWETRDLGLLAGIAFANGGGKLDFKQALDLVGANFGKILGLDSKQEKRQGVDEWVIWEGNPLEIGGRVKAASGAERTFVWE